MVISFDKRFSLDRRCSPSQRSFFHYGLDLRCSFYDCFHNQGCFFWGNITGFFLGFSFCVRYNWVLFSPKRKRYVWARCVCRCVLLIEQRARVSLKASLLLQLQMIKAIINSHRFKSLRSDEPRRMQVLDLYCLAKFESKVQAEEKSIKDWLRE